MESSDRFLNQAFVQSEIGASAKGLDQQSESFSKTVYMKTEDAYDRWAQVYDTDGNFLQAIDDRELQTLLPDFLSSAQIRSRDDGHGSGGGGGGSDTTVVDLGCGTGRNTLKICKLLPHARIVGLDSSEGMLRVAQSKVAAAGPARVELYAFDINAPDSVDKIYPAPAHSGAGARAAGAAVTDALSGNSSSTLSLRNSAAAVISTLVIEHIALATFFAMATRLLAPRGHLLLTNMHGDMGRISQAGFVDPATGEKVRPKSYAHTVREVVDEAARWGLETLQVHERDVKEADVHDLGVRSKKWVGINCWYGIVFRLK